MKKRLVLVMILAFIVGCVAPRVYQRTAKFNEAEYAPYKGTGNCSLVGQAFLKTRGGEVKLAAGNPIWLNPVTSYSTEWFNVTMSSFNPRERKYDKMSDPDPRIHEYHRSTIADGSGRFEFHNLPAGDYYVVTYVTWEVPNYGTSGGVVGSRVKLTPGNTKKVILTR